MAILKQYHQQLTTKVKKEKHKRQMTICRGKPVPNNKLEDFYPDIRLQGKWLRDCGFRSGHVIDIICKNRKLIITIASNQRFILD